MNLVVRVSRQGEQEKSKYRTHHFTHGTGLRQSGYMKAWSRTASTLETYQHSVAKSIPANKKWTSTTEVIVRAACEALSPYLQRKDKYSH